MIGFWLILICFEGGAAVPAANSFQHNMHGQAVLQGWQLAVAPAAATPDEVPATAFQPVDDVLLAAQPAHGMWWLRTTIELDETVSNDRILALCPEGLASAIQVYWDGRLIAESGRVGGAGEEQLGRYYAPVPLLPELIKPGRHQIDLRVSNHHTRRFWHDAQILFGDYEDLLKSVGIWQVKVYFALGLFCVAGVFFLGFTTVRDTRFEALLLVLMCVAFAGRLLFENLWVFDTLRTDYYDFQLFWRRYATVLTGVLSLAALGFWFKQRRALVVMMGLWLVSQYGLFDGLTDADSLLLCACVGMACVAPAQRRDALWPVLALVLGRLTAFADFRVGIDLMSWLGIWLAASFLELNVLALRRREQVRQTALLRSARLENQMLKNFIKPHYLMNALTSVSAWMRREPETADALITALAEEFRQIAAIADQALIPLARELTLCRNHLRIMSLRKGATFDLVVEGALIDTLVPPLILHTLVENGLTHGYETRDQGIFRFSVTAGPSGLRLTLFNDSAARADAAGGEGTGLTYVRARLAETFGDQAVMQAGAVAGGWRVVIEMPRVPADQAAARRGSAEVLQEQPCDY